MCWQQVQRGGVVVTNPNPGAGAHNSATNGDLDAAYALLLAANKWGCERYRERALAVCKALLQWCIHPRTNVLTVGDWCQPVVPQHAISRHSDYMLTHLALFAQEDTANRQNWTAVFDATRAALVQLSSLHTTGLVPDFAQLDAVDEMYRPPSGRVLETDNDPHFFYNACRVPWRLAVYYHETKDEAVLPALLAMQMFFESQQEVVAGYTLEGKPLADYPAIPFLAPVWCLFEVMGSGHSRRVAAAIEGLQAQGYASYYGETIELLCLLQLQLQDEKVSAREVGLVTNDDVCPSEGNLLRVVLSGSDAGVSLQIKS
ncbi:hypothetical protein WJX72_005859 [[Myrmecia] bisecta]|uniref:Cellulase n=1 Tax=[Myrmecia] bisecta TaxID=41462 RepID=A0AAW1QQP3_9CHLO